MIFKMSGGNLTTDAVPRLTDAGLISGPTDSSVVSYSEIAGAVSLPNSSSSSLPVVTSTVNSVVQQAQTTININNGQNLHIGDKLVYNIDVPVVYQKSSKKSKKKSTEKLKTSCAESKPSPEFKALMESTACVTTGHILNIRVGEPWKMVMRRLGISDPDIENTYEQYMIAGGIKEVVYQLLRLWVESTAPNATLDKLSNALWREQQYEALNTLVQEFNISVSPQQEESPDQ